MIPGTKKSVASLLDITERVRAQERLQRQLDELGVLHAAATACVEAASEDELIESITQIIGETLYSDNVGVLLLDEPAGVLHVHPSYRGIDEKNKGLVIPIGQQGVTGMVAATGQPLLVSDVTQEPAYLNTNPKTRSEMCVPLKVGERVIGVINAESTRLDAFSEADERLLVTMAGLLATAVERLRTGVAEREQRVLAESLHDTAVVLNSTLDSDEVLDRILENLGRVVPFKAANIMLIEGGVVRVARHRGYTALGLEAWIMGLQLRITEVPSFRRMLKTQQPLVIADTHVDPEWAAFPETSWIRSYAAAPIRKNGEVIGLLNLDHATPGFFTPTHAGYLQAFADQVAIALENAQLFEAERQRSSELATLAEVSSALRVARTRAEMLPVILDQVLDVLQAGGAALAMRDTTSGETVIELARGSWARTTGLRIPPGQGVSGRVIASGELYLNDDVRSDPQIYYPELGGETPAMACVPLVARGQTIGALWVGSTTPITREKIRLLTAIGDMAANAIFRATLHEKTERALKRLDALRTIDMAINASVDLRLTLDILLEQVTTQLGVDAADVLLLVPRSQTLIYAAGRGFRSDGITRSRVRIGDALAGRIALERRIIHVPDLSESEGTECLKPVFAEEDIVAYYGVPLIAKGKIIGVLEIFHRASLEPDAEWLNFLEALAGQAAIAVDNATLFDNLQRSNFELALAYEATLEGWSRALDLRDKETEGHTQRVTELTMRLARTLGMTEDELVHVRRGALLHDIGKMGVPDSILHKHGSLTDEEWEIMRQHPVHAFELLSPIAYLRPALDIPYCHHEKWDGTGYPRGLKGEQIPLAARIFAVVDVWDALISDRPYCPAWPEEKALEYIREQAGKHFDPHIVELFLKVVNEDTQPTSGVGKR
jgi:putative nucleotidyltransferase with HDIG domain